MLLRPFPLISEEEGSAWAHMPLSPTLPVGGPSLHRGCLAAAPVDGPTAVSFPSRPLPPLLSLLRHQRWYRASCRKREAWGPSHAVPRPVPGGPGLSRAGAVQCSHHVLSFCLTGPFPDCFGQSGGDLVASSHVRTLTHTLTSSPGTELETLASCLLASAEDETRRSSARRGGARDVRAGSLLLRGRAGRGGAAGSGDKHSPPDLPRERGACPLLPPGPARRW